MSGEEAQAQFLPFQMQALTQHLETLIRRRNEELLDRLDQWGRQGHIHDAPKPAQIEGFKIHIPPFKGENDPQAYIEWEMKIDQLFSCNNYTEKKKVRVAAMNLSHHALAWWNHGENLSTWDEMKNLMRLCFAPCYYLELHNSKKEKKVRKEEKKSEKNDEVRKEKKSEKNEDVRKEKEGENISEDEIFSSLEVHINSNDISLSSGVETILQDQACDFTSPLRIENHVSLIPSAPLATQPTFLSNPQELEQEVVHVNLNHMDNCFSIGDKACMMSMSSHDYTCAIGKEIYTGSSYAFKISYIFEHLDEYSFLQSVWHVDWNSRLAFDFDDHKCFGSWLAFMRIVFDPGVNQELNSRTNFLEEGENDENQRGALED